LKTLLAATLVLRGATLVDGTGAPPRQNALLVIRGGRIVSVGIATPEAVAALPKDSQVVDVAGKWVLPGLIDAHVHAESDADLKTMLRWGVTSVRLMAEDVAAANMLARESGARMDVPEVFPAAPIFTVRGGWWAQGEPPDAHLDRFPETVQGARDAVRKAKALGSSEIKLMLDDMAWCRPPALTRMRPEIAVALLDEARRSGMRASVHAPELTNALEAIEGGATALAHGVLDSFDAKTIAVMKARPVFYIPTMDIFEFLADTRSFVDAVLSDPRVTRPGSGLPEETVAKYRSREYSDGYRRRYSAFENVKRHLPSLSANLKALWAAGVPIALGTDMWAFPGLGVSIELDLFVRAGLPPLEAIRAATQTSACSLGIDGDRGTLEAGKRADVLVLSADPLADVKNVRSISRVYKAGFPVPAAAR
jgi:imidazolonepropionase-like amidohydrolase